MYDLLNNMTIVEASSFVASPSAGLHLAQLGANVIRIDHVEGGPDFKRWPISDRGDSLYWEGLNKAKKSIALNLKSEEGRKLAQQLATAPGKNQGMLITNYPLNSFLSHEKLSKLRDDLITVRVMGQADGGPALDYTVNSAVGIPQITGPAEMNDAPVNHVLPAWDLMCGTYAACALLAAERHRQETGKGQELRIPLMDLAISTVANLGQVGEVLHTQANRERIGNDLFGTFGRDFVTKDGKRIVVIALTPRHWHGLLAVLGIEAEITKIETDHAISFAKDEGLRYQYREHIKPLVAGKISARNYAELTTEFDKHHCCWGPYQTTLEAAQDPVLVTDNPVFSELKHPSGLSYPAPGAPVTIPQATRKAPTPAPELGIDTEEVLRDLLGMSSVQIDQLNQQGIISLSNR